MVLVDNTPGTVVYLRREEAERVARALRAETFKSVLSMGVVVWNPGVNMTHAWFRYDKLTEYEKALFRKAFYSGPHKVFMERFFQGHLRKVPLNEEADSPDEVGLKVFEPILPQVSIHEVTLQD